MPISQDLKSLFAAFFLLSVSAITLLLIYLQYINREIMQILSVVAGATSFSGLSLFVDYARKPAAKRFIQIRFDSNRLQNQLSDVIDADYRELYSNIKLLKSEDYSDDDIILSLAKIRIDLEREIRNLAVYRELLRPDQRFNMRRSLDLLARENALPSIVLAAIEDILPVCNRAIHGEQIDTATARHVINIARDIMVVIRGEGQKVAGN